MLITNTINKKILESIIHETFSNFGNVSSSYLLDSLKFLGFYYATNAGISINIEDLKTPKSKQEIIDKVSIDVRITSENWENGFISDIERFQTIIDSWNNATEFLKNKIVDYYQSYDPVNNLYIMAFSGARGNMSQVRQLVGMRGLMSDQEGNIIDLPIQTNFREGLSSLDYIISSYGARKGIVDTALKTADSGYLTRRLIYVAQDLIIREIDCKTENGILFNLTTNNNYKNILGRILTKICSKQIEQISFLKKYKLPILLDQSKVLELKNENLFTLLIRSPLTCNSPGSICQKCYGFDLSQNKYISLGDTVGITAAQSIGEPGTQLTMRTFHTGGIFTSELLDQVKAPFSGKLSISSDNKSSSYRNNHGQVVYKLQQETDILLENWKGKKEIIHLPLGSFLYKNKSSFIKKGELISESSTRSSTARNRKLKPIYSTIDGEIKIENLLVRYIFRKDQAQIKINQDDGILWLTSGKIIPLPNETFLNFSTKLKFKKAIGFLKIITPISGIVFFDNKTLTIKNKESEYTVDFSIFNMKFRNTKIRIIPIIKNYQYLDAQSILAYIYIYPVFNEKIYYVRNKNSSFLKTLFFITESDTWKINSEQIHTLNKNISIIRSGTNLNSTLTITKSGFLLKKDGSQYLFQKAMPIFLTRGAILNYKKGDFVLKSNAVATLIKYKQQTEDIVQGLPKIEELLEARIPLNKCILSKLPGIFFKSNHLELLEKFKLNSDLELFEFKVIQKKLKDAKNFKKTLKGSNESNNNDLSFIIHKLKNRKTNNGYKKELKRIENIKPKKKTKSSLLEFQKKKKEALKAFNPFINYDLPSISNVLSNSGEFLDLGEPLTDGLIDPHELLNLLYKYHERFDGTLLGNIKSINKFQLILLNSIQGIYNSQGVTISSKHIEIIVRQMTNKVLVKESGQTQLLPNEVIRLSLMTEIMKSSLKNFEYKSKIIELNSKGITSEKNKKSSKILLKISNIPKYEPLLISVTNSSLSKDGFLSSAGFQETKRVLIKAAIEGTTDWLRGLKESIIIGRIIPAGSAYLNYKHYLDNIFYFQRINKHT